jgi:CRISPR-associated exonuclease Cas4
MGYLEEDFLSLSGIQHFSFCRRQWALIHIEQQWAENLRTVEGEILHEKAHDGYRAEKRSDVIKIFGREGLFLPVPVEYKRGSPKETEEDVLQLTAQAMCLEEMLLCGIPEGYLFYGETNHRIKIGFDDAVRQKVIMMFKEMHELYDRRYTPKVKTGKHCRACSLADICLPKLCRDKSALQYIQSHIEEEKS